MYQMQLFIHSGIAVRDRLRNAGVQSEMIDQLGGWTRQSVGQGYGKGYDLRSLSLTMLSLG